jgi:hypothetical protein
LVGLAIASLGVSAAPASAVVTAGCNKYVQNPSWAPGYPPNWVLRFAGSITTCNSPQSGYGTSYWYGCIETQVAPGQPWLPIGGSQVGCSGVYAWGPPVSWTDFGGDVACNWPGTTQMVRNVFVTNIRYSNNWYGNTLISAAVPATCSPPSFMRTTRLGLVPMWWSA